METLGIPTTVLANGEAKVEGEQQTAPSFVEVRVAKGARADLGRPKEPPQVNKALFMSALAIKQESEPSTVHLLSPATSSL